MASRSAILIALAILSPAACGGEASSTSPPCVVAENEMASILDKDDVLAAPQQNGLDCIYASEGDPLIRLSVRTREQFQAERDRFESGGIKLPPLSAVEGFDGEANIDPRYNSLNVEAGERIVSVEVVAPEPSDAGEQLEIEKRIARATLERL